MGKEQAGKGIVKGFNSLRKALGLADNLPLERAAEAADPAVLNKVDQLLMGQGIDPQSIGTYEDKIKTLITKPDAYAEYRKTLNEVYGAGDNRAEAAKWGNKDWFHGTTVPIDEFKKDALGLSTNAKSAEKGFFFTDHAPTAGDYSDLAANSGIIREGDTVTTRMLSETAPLLDDLDVSLRDANMEKQFAIDSFRRQVDRNDNTQKLIEAIKNRGEKDEIAERLPKLQADLARGEKFIIDQQSKIKTFDDQIKNLDDKIKSQGQNVIPVKLRAKDGKIHVKDYKGQGYRDTTYADEMTKAQEKGNSGVLFKNTYDPADPNNRVQQNIAAVFEPEQIRSKFAAFDPALNKSKWIMAGAAGAAINMLPEESEGSMANPKSFKQLAEIAKFKQGYVVPKPHNMGTPKITDMGNVKFETAEDGMKTIIRLPDGKTFNVTSDKGDSLNMAQEMIYGRSPSQPGTGSMGEPGKISGDVAGTMERSLDETQVIEPKFSGDIPVKKSGGFVGAGLAGQDGFGMMKDSAKDMLSGLKQGFDKYREVAVKPVSDKLKKTLTPDINVGKESYPTSSVASDFILENAPDATNYVAGGVGAAVGASDLASSFVDDEEAKKRELNFGGLRSILNKK